MREIRVLNYCILISISEAPATTFLSQYSCVYGSKLIHTHTEVCVGIHTHAQTNKPSHDVTRTASVEVTSFLIFDTLTFLHKFESVSDSPLWLQTHTTGTKAFFAAKAIN